MKDLKQIHYYETLLEQMGNDLVTQEKDAGGVAVGYTCYYVPEALLNCGKAFSVRLRAPKTGSLDISRSYMSSFICGYTRALFERAFGGGMNETPPDASLVDFDDDEALRFDQAGQQVVIIS